MHITPIEAAKILSFLPEWSVGRPMKEDDEIERVAQFRVRAPIELSWETGLRPITIARLRIPENYTRGSKQLYILAANDKARYERAVPLTLRARAILEAVVADLEDGPIFGSHDYRPYLAAAAFAALPKEKSAAFARYDFRHGRAHDLVKRTSNMLGVARILGHKQLTTTNAYLAAQHDDAVSALDEAGELGTIPSRSDEDEEDDPEKTRLKQSGREDSNLRPLDPQSSALTRLRYAPRYIETAHASQSSMPRIAEFSRSRPWSLGCDEIEPKTASIVKQYSAR